jgi:hypothetical protein
MIATKEVQLTEAQTAPPVCLCPWRENPRRLVSLWDMRFEAVKAIKALELLARIEMASIFGHSQIASPTFYKVMSGHFDELTRVLEDLELPRQAKKARDMGTFIRTHNKSPDESSVKSLLLLVHHDLESYAFEAVPISRAEFYDHPRKGWEEVVDRFPAAITDIEEMNKCFALSRYPAAVFHSVQTIECALIEFGKFLGVNDPKSGWTAVTGKLTTLVIKTKYPDLDAIYQQHFVFLEQMQALIGALSHAWRNKISHAQGKLVLMTSEFAPEVAEEIMVTTRSFMRRLATELPPVP